MAIARVTIMIVPMPYRRGAPNSLGAAFQLLVAFFSFRARRHALLRRTRISRMTSHVPVPFCRLATYFRRCFFFFLAA